MTGPEIVGLVIAAALLLGFGVLKHKEQKK